MNETATRERDDHLEGGFKDPVFDAQAAFHAIMNAFARPGTLAGLGGLARPPEPVPPAAGAVLATLADHDTPVWLDDAARTGGMGEWLSFHTGAAAVGDPAAARFALACDPGGMPALDAFAQGSDSYPDRSATLLVSLPSLQGGAALTLRGPGIDTEAMVAPLGLGDGFLRDWRANHALYPRGVDVVLVSGDRAMALPRTTSITRR